MFFVITFPKAINRTQHGKRERFKQHYLMSDAPKLIILSWLCLSSYDFMNWKSKSSAWRLLAQGLAHFEFFLKNWPLRKEGNRLTNIWNKQFKDIRFVVVISTHPNAIILSASNKTLVSRSLQTSSNLMTGSSSVRPPPCKYMHRSQTIKINVHLMPMPNYHGIIQTKTLSH